jgi:hypothetical protein
MDLDASWTNEADNGGQMNAAPSPMFPSAAPGFLTTAPPPSNPSFGPPSPQQNAPLFGMVASGMPLKTEFVPTDPSGTKFTMTLTSPGDLPSPLTLVHELAVFLLPSAATGLPLHSGIMIYWQLQVWNGPSSGFELLGTLSPSNRTSDIFRTGWAEHDQFLTLSPNQPCQINIGISVEPLESVRNVEHDDTGTRRQQITNSTAVMARGIGQDLFNYMRSFDTNGAVGNQTIAVPANTFDRWWQRFERKLQRDPNFFMKNNDL